MVQCFGDVLQRAVHAWFAHRSVLVPVVHESCT
jgi:hypothetical protein